jgi:hypothetical protein
MMVMMIVRTMDTRAMIVKILPSIRPMLTFCSLLYWMPDALMSFLALLPKYQAIGAKIVMKMPWIPKSRIYVPCVCSCVGAQ